MVAVIGLYVFFYDFYFSTTFANGLRKKKQDKGNQNDGMVFWDRTEVTKIHCIGRQKKTEINLVRSFSRFWRVKKRDKVGMTSFVQNLMVQDIKKNTHTHRVYW